MSSAESLARERNDPGANSARLAAPSAGASWLRWLALSRGQLLHGERLHALALLVLVLAALAARLPLLDRPMRYDESFTFVRYASRPLLQAIADYSFPNNHLFHTVLVHLTYLLFGNEPWALRLPALLAGLLLVPATYFAIRAIFNRDAAIVAAALAACSAALVDFSTNARGYSLQALFFVLSLGLTPALLQANRRAPWMLFALLSALGFYTLPTMLYPYGAMTIWLLLLILTRASPAERPVLIRNLLLSSVAAGLLTLALYTPVLLHSGLRALVGNRYVVSLKWTRFVDEAGPALQEGWEFLNNGLPLPLVVALALGALVSLAPARQLSRYRPPALGVALLWIGSAMVAQRVLPPERTWLFLLPLYFGAAAAGLVYLARRALEKRARLVGPATAGLGVVIGVTLTPLVVDQQLDSYRPEAGACTGVEEIVMALKPALRPNDRVMAVFPTDYVTRYYFKKHGLSSKYLVRRVEPGHRTFVIVGAATRRSTSLAHLKGLRPGDADALEMRQKCKLATLYRLEHPR